jgi:hypothetical protein
LSCPSKQPGARITALRRAFVLALERDTTCEPVARRTSSQNLMFSRGGCALAAARAILLLGLRYGYFAG